METQALLAPDAPAPVPTDTRTPVTVLTGFLGAGKTTLLNRILSEQHGLKIAVIENEFGEVGVDNELVIGADEEIFEMNNGCICCTVRGDLIRILNNLMKRKDKLDYVLIETTGLADPAPVAQTFFVDEDMQEQYRIDAIVTLVDARHILLHLDDSDEAVQQIAFADVILLNKTDLVTTEELDRLEWRLRGMNAVARIHRTQNADLPIQDILNVRAFDLEAKAELNPEFLQEELPFEWAGIFDLNEREYALQLAAGPDPTMDLLWMRLPAEATELAEKPRHAAIVRFSEDPELRKPGTFLKMNEVLNQLVLAHGGASSSHYRFKAPKPGRYALLTQHLPEEFNLTVTQDGVEVAPLAGFEYAASHEHDDTVTSVGIDLVGDVNQAKFNAWMSQLLQTQGPNIFRMKGIIAMQGSASRFVFQGVHMLFDATEDRPWRPDEPRRNQLVFIGRELNRQALNESFRRCLTSPNKR